MSGLDRVDNQNIFLRVEISKTRGIGLSSEGDSLKEMCGARCFTQSGGA